MSIMKKWETPEINELRLKNTNETRDWPHYWECLKCGKHHGKGWIDSSLNKPTICGYNGCDSTEFKWSCDDENIIVPAS